MIRLRSALACILLGLAAGTSIAQTFPSKPIRWIVPAPPSSSNDTLARIVANKLTERLPQPVVIDNRPGAGSQIASEALLKSAPDGHTILMTPVTHAINATLNPNQPYDAIRDFSAVGQLATQPLVVIVSPAAGITTLDALIARARSAPGKLSYASGGNGTPQHLAGELFKLAAGLDIQHIPYKGSPSAIIDLLSGRIDLMIEPMITVIPHVKSGKLRALALTAPTRSPALPDLPTVRELGLRDYEVIAWYGVLAPALTPAAAINALNSEINRVLALPAVIASYAAQGATANGGTPQQFQDLIASEITKWGKAVAASKAKVD